MRFILLFLLVIPSAFAQDINPGVVLHHDLFNSKQDTSIACYRIPAIVTAPNGDLIAAIDERVPSCGDLKWSKDINIVIRRSADNGKTWMPIEKIIDFPDGQSASDPSMIVDEITGDIFMLYNFMDLDKERDVYYLHVIKSSDNGKTWSRPADITQQITPPEWHSDFKFITSGRGIQTSKGTLLHTLVNLTHGTHLFGSDDHGDSWYLINTPIQPGDESKVVELSDGSWMVNSRVNKTSTRYVHRSTDAGQSWQSAPDSTLVDPACNGSLIRYNHNGHNLLLFSNANHPEKRENLTVRYSKDEGKTWSNGKVIYAGGSAYSSLTVLANGDIGVFFEKDGYKENVFVRFELDWLISRR